MIAAEQWYQHQENYQKYGLDMKPRTERKRPEPQKRVFSDKDRARLLVLIAAMGVLLVGMIISTAFAATIQYNTNKIIAENHVIQTEIENLEVQLHAATNIEAIETKAAALGMVYPETKQVVHISASANPPEGFAQMMKNQAYN